MSSGRDKKMAPAANTPAVKPAEPKAAIPKMKLAWGPVAVLIAVALIYSNALSNGFTNFDDDFYVINNPFLKDFSFQGLKAIFSSFYFANYHPLTTFTYWLEYHFFGASPMPYHAVNALLHLANTWLVYRLTKLLSGKEMVGLFTALFFGIHPMHVESVAWVAERKDVLYTFFYLLSLHSYLLYIKAPGNRKLLVAVFVFFILSLLSKSAAVTLPVLLIAIDVYKGRKFSAATWIEKAPMLALSVVFGVVAIFSQKEAGALHALIGTHTLVEKFFFVCFGLASYFVRLIAPLGLSAIHGYPDKAAGWLPWYYYASVMVLVVVGWLVAKPSKYRRDLVFGMAFFLISISVMLQVVAVGSAVTAERYTYVAYIGLFYAVGLLVSDLLGSSRKNGVIIAVGALALLFSAASWTRISVWKNGNTLFTDAIEKDPDHYFAWWMRGNLYAADGNFDDAIDDYTRGLKSFPNFEQLHYNRAHAYFEKGNAAAAIADYHAAIALSPKMAEAYNDLGWALYKANNRDSAIFYLNKAINISPGLAEAYNNRGSIYVEMGNPDAAVKDFDRAITLNKTYETAYLNRAALRASRKEFMEAIADYSTVIEMNEKNADARYNRGIVKLNMGDKDGACTDWIAAKEQGFEQAQAAIERFCGSR